MLARISSTLAGPTASPKASGPYGYERPSTTARSRSAGEAMRICAMSQPTFTTCATTRCATKPAESLITDTGTPSAASSPCAASRASFDVAGLVIRVRRLAKPKSGSTATVRVASRPSSTAQVEASLPSGATMQIASPEGLAPPSTLAPSLDTSSFSAAGASGASQTVEAFAAGTGCSGTATGPSLVYSYQPRPVLRPSRPAATRIGER